LTSSEIITYLCHNDKAEPTANYQISKIKSVDDLNNPANNFSFRLNLVDESIEFEADSEYICKDWIQNIRWLILSLTSKAN